MGYCGRRNQDPPLLRTRCYQNFSLLSLGRVGRFIRFAFLVFAILVNSTSFLSISLKKKMYFTNNDRVFFLIIILLMIYDVCFDLIIAVEWALNVRNKSLNCLLSDSRPCVHQQTWSPSSNPTPAPHLLLVCFQGLTQSSSTSGDSCKRAPIPTSTPHTPVYPFPTEANVACVLAF